MPSCSALPLPSEARPCITSARYHRFSHGAHELYLQIRLHRDPTSPFDSRKITVCPSSSSRATSIYRLGDDWIYSSSKMTLRNTPFGHFSSPLRRQSIHTATHAHSPSTLPSTAPCCPCALPPNVSPAARPATPPCTSRFPSTRRAPRRQSK